MFYDVHLCISILSSRSGLSFISDFIQNMLFKARIQYLSKLLENRDICVPKNIPVKKSCESQVYLSISQILNPISSATFPTFPFTPSFDVTLPPPSQTHPNYSPKLKRSKCCQVKNIKKNSLYIIKDTQNK